MTSQIVYKGNLRTESTHLQSGTKIITDAPVDNHGKGEAFSPTDLVANALGCCMITIMGIKAESMGIDLTGTSIDITKTMSANPRRIAEIEVTLHIPTAGISDKDKMILEKVAHTCPVAQTLSENTVQNVLFSWEV